MVKGMRGVLKLKLSWLIAFLCLYVCVYVRCTRVNCLSIEVHKEHTKEQPPLFCVFCLSGMCGRNQNTIHKGRVPTCFQPPR